MSHIAAALAKSKGKSAPAPTTDLSRPGAPIIPPPARPSLAPLAAVTKPVAPQLPPLALLGGIAGVIVVIVGVSWFFLGGKSHPAQAPEPTVVTAKPAAPPAPAVQPKSPPPVVATNPASNPAKPPAAPGSVVPPPTPAPSTPPAGPAPTRTTAVDVVAATPSAAPAPHRTEPTAELQAVVLNLPMTAAMAGDNQRIFVGKHMFIPGDTVAEGLVLHEVQRGVVIFRDDAGAFYRRRY